MKAAVTLLYLWNFQKKADLLNAPNKTCRFHINRIRLQTTWLTAFEAFVWQCDCVENQNISTFSCWHFPLQRWWRLRDDWHYDDDDDFFVYDPISTYRSTWWTLCASGCYGSIPFEWMVYLVVTRIIENFNQSHGSVMRIKWKFIVHSKVPHRSEEKAATTAGVAIAVARRSEGEKFQCNFTNPVVRCGG